MKRTIQGILRKLGLYQRVKTSLAYDLYWKMADARLIQERTREVSFFQQVLQGFQEGDLIFDVGANMGQKTDVFLRLGARVVAVDPDRSNQEILRQRFLAWRLRKKPVTIVGKAVSDSLGTHTMWVDEPGSAKNTLNPKWVDTLRIDAQRFGTTLQFAEKQEVETTTLEELFRIHGRPYYIKIDVEGHEPAVLKGLRSAVPYVSFEVNLPEFKPEAMQCVELLNGVAPQGQFNHAADCQKGLASERWRSKADFLKVLDACSEPCIEVFWKSAGN